MVLTELTTVNVTADCKKDLKTVSLIEPLFTSSLCLHFSLSREEVNIIYNIKYNIYMLFYICTEQNIFFLISILSEHFLYDDNLD